MMKVAIIVPYFGTLPNYFQLFLNSCRYNGKFDWIIFTDDCTEYDYPENVHKIKMNFSECKNLIQGKFPFDISLNSPQKLCDFKPAYGYIFDDYLLTYDWWGHCDLDQIFGDLSQFVTEERLEKYEKIYSLGHLTLYKNIEKINKLFMKDLNGISRYKDVFTNPLGEAFDEWLPGNINEIFIDQHINALYENDGADINSYYTQFRTVDYDVKLRKYINSEIKNSIFLWDKGRLFQIYVQNRLIKKKEFPYVHLQKRKMKDCRINKNVDKFYIIPNKFIDEGKDAINLLNKCMLYRIFNYQFFKVKYASLKLRIKNNNWKRQNVFD